MQYPTEDWVRVLTVERLDRARGARRAAIVVRERRWARRAEDRSRPTRLRLARAVLRTADAG